jgi:6-phosphogluconolactonase
VIYFTKSESKIKTEGTAFYVGTYTNSSSEGIYKYNLLDSGELALIGLAAKSENPSFLSKSADNKYLIAVNENERGTVESFKIDGDSLPLISKSLSGGMHPCFVAANNAGDVLVANYSSGTIGYLQINAKGKLSPLLDVQQNFGQGSHERQKSPHAHAVRFNPTDDTFISVDLGTNEILFSALDPSLKKISPSPQYKLKMEAGAGPRHLAFHPNNKWIYVINELNSSLSLLKKEAGTYSLSDSFSTLPENYAGENSCADIHISNDGKFLYASNRGHNSIAIYMINANGSLKLIGHELCRGDGPRNFALSPDNNFLLVANQLSNNIVSFKRDPATGKLAYISEIEAHVPVCILF